MKRLSFVLGSLFLLTAFASPIFAHTFFQPHGHDDLAARPHTERIAPLSYYRQLNKDFFRFGARECNTEARVQVPTHPAVVNQFGRTIPTEVNSNTIDDITRRANTYQNRYTIVRKGNYVDRGYDVNAQRSSRSTYAVADQGDYSLTNPRGFSLNNNGDYRADGTSLAYRVLSLDQNQCNENNVWTCAQSQNQAFRASDAFSVVRNVESSFRWNQTSHTDFDYFPTVTESFDAVVNGKTYTYYTYTALNPVDNTMVRIEGVSQSAEKRRAAQTAFQIFETFRFQ